MPVEAGAESLAVTPDGSSVYVSSGFGNEEVSVIDTEVGFVARGFRVPGGAEGLALGHGGRQVYVATGLGSRSTVYVDTETDRIMGSTTVGTGPMSVAVEYEPEPVDSRAGTERHVHWKTGRKESEAR
ncbi:YncE family protein [Streptomyces litmocidini]|uniref:YncE family protein n=1 Tax=Streptomyces litmocidini TaxID=67318 RepID=UPI0036F64B22